MPRSAEVGYTYDRYGRVTELDRGNGVTTTYEFTSVNQIATETTTGPDGDLQSERAYTYDPRGNLTQRTDTTQQPRPPDAGAGLVTTTTGYTYDIHDRLIRVLNPRRRHHRTPRPPRPRTTR